MTKQLKEIKIPFGAKDSELCGWEYTIPEGMEATIVDNKIVVKKKESEDERIKKAIITLLNTTIKGKKLYSITDTIRSEMIAWLEKQGEQKQEETWPNLSNCLHDCKKCTGKCFYRKEKYQGEYKSVDKVEQKGMNIVGGKT